MKLNFRSLVAVVGLVVVAAGLLGGTSASAQNRDAAPASAQSRDSAYRVRPGDKLFISVWKEEGLAQTAIVRPDGGFTFPLAGELNATDKTVAALAEEIRARLVRLIPEARRHRRRRRAPRGAHLHHRTGADAGGIHHALHTGRSSGAEHGGRRDSVRVTGRHPDSASWHAGAKGHPVRLRRHHSRTRPRAEHYARRRRRRNRSLIQRNDTLRRTNHGSADRSRPMEHRFRRRHVVARSIRGGVGLRRARRCRISIIWPTTTSSTRCSPLAVGSKPAHPS